MSIPITVGVTGHRDLPEESLGQIRAAVRTELEKIKNMCPNSELVMINSLAAGADTICAEEALDLGFKLICPLPVELSLYKEDFSDEEKKTLEMLLHRAEKVFTAPDVEPKEESRNYHFRQAGIYVAAHSHVLMAMWDGTPSKVNGCGTAETVDFKLKRTYEHSHDAFSCGDGAVIHIHTPRKSKNAAVEIKAELIENTSGMLETILRETDTFNQDCRRPGLKKRKLLECENKPEHILSLEECNGEAAALSQYFQNKYTGAIKLLSVFSVVLVMSYLLYDEANLLSMLYYYGAVLIFYYLSYRRIVSGRYHEKYISYRMLAESSRVQTYLTALGLRENAAEYYTWTQKKETAWIKAGMDALSNGAAAECISRETVLSAWIRGQLSYNKAAYKKNDDKARTTQMISNCTLAATVILFITVLLLELCGTDFVDSKWFGIEWRSWFKILWGTISAVTVFLSGFYGNLSLERKSADNSKMTALFQSVEKDLAEEPDNDELLIKLAREEIIENGNWASYCKENKPMFSL